MKKILCLICLSIFIISCTDSIRDAQLLNSAKTPIQVTGVPNSKTSGEIIYVKRVPFNKYGFMYSVDSINIFGKAVLQ